jgi:hypothetical protein
VLISDKEGASGPLNSTLDFFLTLTGASISSLVISPFSRIAISFPFSFPNLRSLTPSFNLT